MLDMQLSFLKILGFKGFSSPSNSPFSCPELSRSGKRENSMLVTQMSFISLYLLLPSSHKGIASEFPSLREGIGVGSYFLPQGGGQEGALSGG